VTFKPLIPGDKGTNDDVFTGDWNLLNQEWRWEQEVAAGTNANKIDHHALQFALTEVKNLVKNPNFDIATIGGTGPWTSAGTGQVTDCWFLNGTGTLDAVTYSTAPYAFVLQSAGAMLFQYLEAVEALRGRELYAACELRGVGTGYLFIDDDHGGDVSATSTGALGPGFGEVLTVSRVVHPSAAYVRVGVVAPSIVGAAYLLVDNVRCGSGYAPPPQVGVHPAVAALQRLRAAQKVTINEQFQAGANLVPLYAEYVLPTPMMGTPSFAVTTGTRTNVNAGATSPSGTPVGVLADRLVYQITPAAAGTCSVFGEVVTLLS
jgi:hypothetical protein